MVPAMCYSLLGRTEDAMCYSLLGRTEDGWCLPCTVVLYLYYYYHL